MIFTCAYPAPAKPDQLQVQLPVDTSYTVWSTFQKLKKEYPQIKPVESRPTKDVRQYNNVVYRVLNNTPYGRRDLQADIFVPVKKKHSPAVLLVHGGGWRAGNKTLNTPMAQRLAANGFVVISVEYRLSLEARYPAAVYDLKAAIQWMRANAKEYHIDTAHLAIAGSSAGGQLAALMGTPPGNLKFEDTTSLHNFSDRVHAVVDLDGLLDFTDPENLAVKRNEKSADVFWLNGFYEDNTRTWQEASALHWVNSQTPPFLFINSGQARFHAGCKTMVERLNAYAIYNEVITLDGSPHSFWLFHPWFDPTIQYMTDFLGKVFAASKINTTK